MAAIALTPGFKALALKVQEAAMQHGDVKARLKDIINDHVAASGKSHADDEYMDHDGDGTEGNCTYMCKGDIRQAPYELGARGGKATGGIDFDNSKNVIPVTSYVPEAEDGDHYTSMDEAFREAGLYIQLPLYERFISQTKRKSMSADSFAGKGRSFPIDTQADVDAALHSVGRAGPDNYSHDTIHSNIIRIAKAKGLRTPGGGKESVSRGILGDLLLEFQVSTETGVELKEAAEFPAKLISPGRGSSGYYSPELLRRDGPSIFKTGTQMYWNHATDTEESERPEGNLDHLAGVLTSDARYDEAGKDGPGLYANLKVFRQYEDKVREMGKHIGLSIRAGGSRDEAASGPDGKKGVITALKNAQSVDFVTKAGRDGKVFTEAARASEGAQDMDTAEVQRMIESAVNPLKEENRKLKEALQGTRLRGEVPQVIHEALEPLRLPTASKKKIFEKFTSTEIAGMLPLKEGKLDTEAIGKLIEAEAIREANFLMDLGYGDVRGIGKRITEAEMKELEKADEGKFEETISQLADIFVGEKLPKSNDPIQMAAREARKTARKAFVNGRAA